MGAKGGRPRKPDHLKIVAGTARKHRMNPAAPKSTGIIPSTPEWLSGRAAELFSNICGIVERMRIISADDVHTLALLASRLEEIEATTAVIEDLGRTYSTTSPSGDSMFRPRPEVAMRNEAMRHAHSLLVEFGLSPAARGKVSAQTSEETNPFKMIG